MCGSSLVPSLAAASQVTRPPHSETRAKVINPNYFLKIEKLNWERRRKYALADGLAEREELQQGGR